MRAIKNAGSTSVLAVLVGGLALALAPLLCLAAVQLEEEGLALRLLRRTLPVRLLHLQSVGWCSRSGGQPGMEHGD